VIGYEIVKARPSHIEDLAPRLRAIDVDELWAAARLRPVKGLAESLRISRRAWTVIFDGAPQAMFGVADIRGKPSWGRPWYLGSDSVLTTRKREFLRESRIQLARIADGYCGLENHVLLGNVAAIRWLRNLGFGFDFDDPVITWNGKSMIRFHKDYFAEVFKGWW
jgi:hypothetical protein